MLRKLLSTLTIVVASAGFAFAQSEGALKVKLVDKANKETIPFANVVVEMGGIQAGIGTTNIDGELTIKPLSPGKYNVKATYVGYQTVEIKDVTVSVGKTVSLNIEMAQGQQLQEVEVVEWSKPLIDPDTKSGGTVTAEEYQNMATKNINSVAATTAGVYQKEEGGELNVRGARSSGTAYYVDGQKVIGSHDVPQASVEQITTIVGGTPAEYGDATGGIISITTKGPASRYAGGVELITSGLGEKKGLDAYGYNYLGFNVSGPLMLRKDSTGVKKSLVGFSVSGEAISEKDPDPSAVGFYKIKDDKLAELEANPLRPSPQGEGFVLNSEYVTKDDLEKIKARQNVQRNTMRLNGKLQYQPTTNMGITVGGSVDYAKRHDFIYEYALYNPSNNPEIISNTWRTYIKLSQKFNSATAKEEEKSSTVIKNAYFTIQANYEKQKEITQDDTHGDNYFNYGYIGKFQQNIRPVYQYDDSVGAVTQAGFEFYDLQFTASDINPNGAAYTSQVYANTPQSELNNTNDVAFNLGLRNGDRPTNIYSMWYNTGRQYNGYNLDNNTQFSVFANFSADIKNHAIQLGFEYQQRTRRNFFVSPIGLWTQMRQLANSHIQDLDLSNPIYNPNPDPIAAQNSGFDPAFWDFYDYNRLNNGEQNQFDRSVREALGLDPDGTDYLDIDSYDPSLFSLDMFSAEDLLNVGGTQYVAYYGYDHTGKLLKGNPSIDDFFTKTNEQGKRTYEIGAYRPVYIAGYIQDKFDFKDLRFNIGLRVDRFDANQPVLKDKYLLYEAKTAGELSIPNRPSNIGDDYVVYVYDAQNPNENQVVGYRNGDTWYNKDGVEVDDPNTSLGSSNSINGDVNPYLVDPHIPDPSNDLSSKVFTDYKPQISVMPRIAFAFPVSDVANFFAHYDILTQRPDEAYSRLDPLQYMNIVNSPGSYVNNPNLKPTKTIDYELGFAQVLNEKKNSSITLSAFYRELRDMVQTTSVYKAYPRTYNSFTNVDFGTVKGFSIAYDLRRLAAGVQMTANYTLQFADGTGSSASDGQNLVALGQPNLRTTHALDYDQRHTITLNVDYRFGSGKDYNGPRWTRKKGGSEKSIAILEDVGANLLFRAGSGTPYSAQGNITPAGQFGIQNTTSLEGSINGSNLPWSFRVDLRVDKNIELTWNSKKGDEKKHAFMNVYLQVMNLLNTKNVLNVYKATGDPDDDGYLTSAQAQTTIAGQNSAVSFVDLYQVKINNPNNFNSPRVIRLGLQISF
jgi:hypothetical protein